jgi:cell division septal protein FtsQ
MSREREVAMRWLRGSRVRAILLTVLALIVYVVMIWGGIPLLWPYRDHRLVRVLLAFLSGGHLEELFQETGAWL